MSKTFVFKKFILIQQEMYWAKCHNFMNEYQVYFLGVKAAGA